MIVVTEPSSSATPIKDKTKRKIKTDLQQVQYGSIYIMQQRKIQCKYYQLRTNLYDLPIKQRMKVINIQGTHTFPFFYY